VTLHNLSSRFLSIPKMARKCGRSRADMYRKASEGRFTIVRRPGSRVALLDAEELTRLGYLRPQAPKSELFTEEQVAARDQEWILAVALRDTRPPAVNSSAGNDRAEP